MRKQYIWCMHCNNKFAYDYPEGLSISEKTRLIDQAYKEVHKFGWMVGKISGKDKKGNFWKFNEIFCPNCIANMNNSLVNLTLTK